MNDQLRHAPIGVIEVTPDGTVEGVNETAAAVIDAERSALRGTAIEDTFPKSTAGTLRDALGDGAPDERSFEEYYPRIDRWLGVDVVPTDERVFVYVRDRSQRHEHRQRIDRLEQRLDRMGTIDSLVTTVLRKVIDASAHEEVSQAVCERLGATDLYEFAWVGERNLTDGGLQVEASGGDAPEMLDQIRDNLAENKALPEREAAVAGETQVVQSIAQDDSIPRDVRLAAFGRGLQSCIAVPLAYRETVYGVLGVYAAREQGFSEQERASLETLGAIAGFAINAIRQEGLLFADTITELTVAVRDPSLPFIEASRASDCRIELDGVVPRDDETVVCYLRPEEGADAAADAVADHESVLTVRQIGDDADGESLLEVAVTGDVPVATFAAWGATICDAEYDGKTARISVEIPSDTELRQLVSAVDTDSASTEVVSKRETERDPETVGAFRSELDEKLTDKQRTVLRTAYLADYFESPRGSSSAEVADALDITGPTILYHLRRGQRKLLETFFEPDPDSSPDAGPRS
jgi:predicted DNA binding protein/putative methionine-R-sulfoxide reductase with GAF domain